jgi:autotransporter-associated beta strand protein
MFMKTRLILFVIALCGAFATTAAFGQATGNAVQTNFVWIAAGSNLDVGTSTNWSPTGVPNPARTGSSSDYGDIMDFNGQTTGPVFATSNGGSQVGGSVGGATAGLYVHVTSNQANRVTLYTTIASGASSGARFNSMTFDAGSGGFTMGTGSTTNCLDTLWGTSNPETQGLTNNSANPAIINLDVRWRLGAGGVHTFVFSGTGDWYITNDIANVNGAGTAVTKDGSGTMYWTAGKNSFWGTETTIGTLNISGGTLVYQSSGLLQNNTTITMSSNAAPSVFEFNVVGGSQTFNNTISGIGSVWLNNGILTLAGANTYTGNTILSGGELIANRAENPGTSGPLGNGGTITFSGGTLGFTVNDPADYSARFNTNANQAYSFDTGGQIVTFGTGLISSGGTLAKLGQGTLTLSGTNTYTGNTTVSAGQLVFGGPMTGTGNITVQDGATLAVTATGAQVQPGTLILGTSSGASLGFYIVNGTNFYSTTTAPLAVGTLSAVGAVTINVNNGAFTVGQSYPLFTWNSGAAPAVKLGVLNGYIGTLSTNGNSIQVNISGTAYSWTGQGGNWDLTSGNNWRQNGAPAVYHDGVPVVFDDTANSPIVNLNALVSPSSITINNTAQFYAMFNYPGVAIAGSTGLTKRGANAMQIIGGNNTYTGPTTLSGGVLNVSLLDNGGLPSDIGAASSGATNLVFDGGSLLFSGGGVNSIDRLFTLTLSGGTIDVEVGTLNLTNTGPVAFSGAGARTLTLAGIDTAGDTLATALADNGGPTAVTKTGVGTWILTGTNTQSGATTISQGTLQIGNGGSTGSLGTGSIVDNSGLVFNRTGSMTINTPVTGNGSVTVQGGGTVILAQNNTYSGLTTISNATLQIGNGGAAGTLNANGTVTNNGLLIYNSTSLLNLTGGGIRGTGNLIVRGSGGMLASLGGNTYTGWTQIDPGSTFMPCEGLLGGLSSSVVTNNGTLLLIRQDNDAFIYSNTITGSGRVLVDANNVNAGDVTLAGNCNYTGGTFIGDNGLKVGTDTNGIGNGWITGNVTFTNSARVPYDNPRTLTFNRPDNMTFPGNIVTNFKSAQNNLGVVVQNGTGVLTLTGNNTYGSGTTINSGSLQIGNGGTSGSVGTGNVTDNGTLIFNRSDNVNFANRITGTGALVQNGSGTVTLTAGTNNTYAGTTTVSNGTLVATNIGGIATVSGGTLVANNIGGHTTVNSGTLVATNIGAALDMFGGTVVPVGFGSVGTLFVANVLTISNGTIVAVLNKASSPSNSVYSITFGTIAYGGTLKLANYGPSLAVGDYFQIFDVPIVGGNTLTIVSPGCTVTNNLATDGSVKVTSVALPSTEKITAAVSGGNLNLSWPAVWTGLHLQVQTNSLANGLGTNWVTIPGSDASNNYVAPIVRSTNNPSVFYRLAP